MHSGITPRLEPLLRVLQARKSACRFFCTPLSRKSNTQENNAPHGNAQHSMQLTNVAMVGRNRYTSRVDSLWDPCGVSPGNVLPHSCYDTPWYTPVISTSRVLSYCFPINATHLVPNSPPDCKIRSHCLMPSQIQLTLIPMPPGSRHKHRSFLPCLPPPPDHPRLHTQWPRPGRGKLMFISISLHFTEINCAPQWNMTHHRLFFYTEGLISVPHTFAQVSWAWVLAWLPFLRQEARSTWSLSSDGSAGETRPKWSQTHDLHLADALRILSRGFSKWTHLTVLVCRPKLWSN